MRRLFGERAVLVVDEKQIGAILRLRPLGPGNGHVDVDIAVVVDVHHRRARRPALRSDACFLSDVLEAHTALVQVQPAGHHVATEENVREAIVVYVADGDTGAVVDIDVGLDVQRITGGDRVGEPDAGFVGAEKLEQRVAATLLAAGQDKDQERGSDGARSGKSPARHPISLYEPTAADLSRHQSHCAGVPTTLDGRRI